MTMRQGEEHHVVAREQVGIGRLEDPVGQRQEVRVVFRQPGARAGRRGQGPDGQPAVGAGGVAEQEP
jgi:hypothetical protein